MTKRLPQRLFEIPHRKPAGARPIDCLCPFCKAANPKVTRLRKGNRMYLFCGKCKLQVAEMARRKAK